MSGEGSDESSPKSVDEGGSTALVSLAPDIVAVYGDLPSDLDLEPLDLKLFSTSDRDLLSTTLTSVGNGATVAGNLGATVANSRGLYRLSSKTLAQMVKTGGKLASKDGGNLGTIIIPGGKLAQARFIPVSAAGLATLTASAGPALAMITLQMSLNQLNVLARRNLALTEQVLTETREQSRAQLTGLVKKVGKTMDHATAAGMVTDDLWATIASKDSDLESQRDLYRSKVASHAANLARVHGRERRQYLENNAEAIVFDTYALLDSLKAWVGYQAIFASRGRTASAEDEFSARLTQSVVDETRAELGPALEEIKELVGDLSRELQLVAELPGRSTLRATKKRKDAVASRQTSGKLLDAIRPLTNHLLPPSEHEDPEVLCMPERVAHDKYVSVLHLLVERGELLRAVGIAYERKDGSVLGELTHTVRTSSPGERLSLATRDSEQGATLIAVTDRRILTSGAKGFLQTGTLDHEIPTDHVRYVRLRSNYSTGNRDAIDLITKDHNIQWSFHRTTEATAPQALAGVLAESMIIPESERSELIDRQQALTSPQTNEAPQDTQAGANRELEDRADQEEAPS